jgi:hypothetical protein
MRPPRRRPQSRRAEPKLAIPLHLWVDDEPEEMAEAPPPEPGHWFGKKEGALGFGPITRQGRVVTALYVLLVVVAIFTYSQLALTAFVVAFYTVAFGCVVIVKSDLMKDHQSR